MSNRPAILTAVHRMYEARESGDLSAVAALMHPNAQFKIAGDPRHSAGPMTLDGREAAMAGIAQLVAVFAFEGLEMIDSVVEGGKVAVHWRATLTHRPSGEVFRTEVFDLWVVGPDGLITGLTQFCDTAMLNHYLARG
jgi:ketosteroid isomerase-like protein